MRLIWFNREATLRSLTFTNWLSRHSHVIVFLLIGLIVFSWFQEKNFIWGDDTNILLKDNLNFPRYFNIWDSNVGKPDALKLPLIMPISLLLQFSSFLGVPYSPALFERVFLYVFFVASGLSVYYLCLVLLPNSGGKKTGAFLAGAFYMFNFFMMTTILPSGAMIMLQYAFYPLVLALYFKNFDKSPTILKSMLIAVLWTVLITPAYITVTVMATDWLVILGFFIFYNLIKRNRDILKKSIIFTGALAGFWLLFNLFWLLPLAEVFSNVQAAYFSFSSGITLYSQNSVTLIDGFRLTGYWGLASSYQGSLYYPWFGIYQTLPFILLSFLPPVLASISLLLFSRKNHYVLFFGLLSVVCLFIVKGLNPPLGEVNQFLFSNDLLSTTFRSSYQRVTGYIVLAYAFLMAMLISRIYSKSHKFFTKRLLRSLSVTLVFVIMVGVFAWPIWTGAIYNNEGVFPSKRVNVPQEYYSAVEWLDKQEGDFSLLPIPYPTKTAYVSLWWDNGTDGYYGTYPFLLLSSKTFLINNAIATAYAVNFSDGKLEDAQALNEINVKYVVVNWDTNWMFIKNHDWWSSPSSTNISLYVNNVTGLILEKTFGNLSFYRNTYWVPQAVQIVPKNENFNASLGSLAQNITYFKVSPSEYQIDFQVTAPSSLILTEPYNDGWNIESNKGSFDHFATQDNLNGWYINSVGDYSLRIVYSPQKILDYGLAISLSALGIAVIVLLLVFANFHKKQCYKFEFFFGKGKNGQTK